MCARPGSGLELKSYVTTAMRYGGGGGGDAEPPLWGRGEGGGASKSYVDFDVMHKKV